MNILITPDVPEWAIGKLTRAIIKHNPRFNFFNMPVHPRGVMEGLTEIKRLLKQGVKFDLWHAQYWNSAYQLMDLMPELKEIPKILVHHNHYALEEKDWKKFDALAIATDWGLEKLSARHPKVVKIPMGIDLDTYSFLDDYPPKTPAVGYVGRVMPHKNLLEICRVCQKMGYRVVGTGYIEKPEYWEACEPFQKEGVLEWNGGFGRGRMMPENFETEFYRKMTVFVMYSTDERETGTLPLLEAMARGVPVLATAQGMARDIIKDGENGLIFNADNFKERLKMLMEDGELGEKLRQAAWQTMKNLPEQRMAREYAKAYYRLLFGEQKMISVIVPTFNRAETLIETIASVDQNNYPAKEIIVCDDGSDDLTPEVVEKMKKGLRTPLLYLKTGTKLEYGLAKARNCGAVEALGEILVFLDDRFKMRPNTLEIIAGNTISKGWQYGKKINREGKEGRKSFVENFSWIMKKDFINGGMFCERMTQYGGLSDETRRRFESQRFIFSYIPEAEVEIILDSPRHKKRGEIWNSKFLIRKMYD
jgi:glycosyltransferase involved in cell wall biosynthesis